MESLFKDYKIEKKTKVKSPRDLIVGDIFNYFESREIKLMKRKMTMGYFATLLSPFKEDLLYDLFSKIKEAKNPAALFWYFTKPK